MVVRRATIKFAPQASTYWNSLENQNFPLFFFFSEIKIHRQNTEAVAA